MGSDNDKPTSQCAEGQCSLWSQYVAHPTQNLRNQLIEYYLPWVQFTAKRVHARLPDEIDIDDLISVGTFGLMDAIDSFDPQRGVKFESYAGPRIRGAILDELRKMDWVPRLVRSRTSLVNDACQSLRMELGRAPTKEELVQRLGIDEAEYEKIRKDTSTVGFVSLSRTWFEQDSNKEVREIDVFADATQPNPLTNAQRRDARDFITRGLSTYERSIVVLYHYQQMTMKDIGNFLGVSESRVSQLYKEIIPRLRARLSRSKEAVF